MQNLHNTIFCKISATEDIIYPFYQHNPPQEILQMFRKFRRAFPTHPLSVEQRRPQICGGVDFGDFYMFGGTLAEQRKAASCNENDNDNHVFC